MTLHYPNSTSSENFFCHVFSSVCNFSFSLASWCFLFPHFSFSPFWPSPSIVLLLILFSDLSLSPWILPTIFFPQSPPPFFLTKQEVLPDRKRVTTRSYLPITPADTDSGSNFTCEAKNPAVLMGKQVTVTLNIHRMLPLFSINRHRQGLEGCLCFIW